MLPIHRVAWLSVGASVATLLLKFSAYYLTDSVSLFSDAMESFVNLSAGLVALLVLTVVARPADENHPYGHDKAEYFSSGVEGALIIVAAISIIWAAWERFNVQQPLSNITQGVLISLAASAINFGVAQYMLRAARQYDSITLEADARHLLTDVWTSVGVAVGLCVLVFAPADWQVLDPIVAILVALNIIHTGFDLLRRSMDGLMDTTLPVEDVRQIRTSIEQSIGVCYSYNQLRSRKSGSRRFIEFNLLLPGDTSVAVAHDLCDQLEDAIERRLSKTTVTIHVEPLEKYLDNPG
ncbi:MAG: cation diffusion facilitator family transporter [Burkholderiales bacterium]|jgi:cation diffusion facilitator family transporter